MLRPSRVRKCAHCREPFAKRNGMQKVCSPACAAAYVQSQKARAERKADRAKREALKPLSYWAGRAQHWFNRYVRLKALANGEGCISCGTRTATVWNAGHFKSVGARPDLRFNEDNVHLQCARPCNHDLSGNALKYREGLIRKIGVERVEALEAQAAPVKMTREHYQDIEAEYKAKCKELERK